MFKITRAGSYTSACFVFLELWWEMACCQCSSPLINQIMYLLGFLPQGLKQQVMSQKCCSASLTVELTKNEKVVKSNVEAVKKGNVSLLHALNQDISIANAFHSL